MASAALPPSHTTPTPESIHQRMDTFFTLRQQATSNDGRPTENGPNFPPPSVNSYGGDPFGNAYQEPSVTSGSNSGDDEEGSGKRMANGFPSSKKRRKQSKPNRIGAESDPTEDRRYSTEEEESQSEAPLNLSSGSGREPGEKPSLRVLGPELMGSAPPHTSELLAKLGHPGNSNLYQAAAAAAAAAGGMMTFGLSPFPFPFSPNSPGQLPKNSPLSGGTPVNSRSQIFNPEAYCELCNKEFCNKYFLKTHKANKHGIYSESLSSPPSGGESRHQPNNNNNNNNSSSNNSGSPQQPFTGAFMAAASMIPPSFHNSSHTPSPGQNVQTETSEKPVEVPLSPQTPPRENGESRRPSEPMLYGSVNEHTQEPFKRESVEKQESRPIPNIPNLVPSKPPSGFPQDKLRSMGVINADAFCEICCKEFCNKYFLRVHKLKKHGICSPDLPPEKVQKILTQMAKEVGKTVPSSPGRSTVDSNMRIPDSRSHLQMGPNSNDKSVLEEGEIAGNGRKEDNEDQEELDNGGRTSEDLQRLQSMIMELNSSKGSKESFVCRICSKSLENKYFLRAHMINEHGVLGGNEGSPSPELKRQASYSDEPAPAPSPLDFTAKFLQQMSKGLMSEEERSYLERVKSEMSSPNRKLDNKDPNRRPASLSRSYCEICKKELCNKYFMKTHMLKMHGINIEATTTTGVSCHICKKELCSKYFLKVHMQNSHGIAEEGGKENGGSGTAPSALFPGLFPPSMELMNQPEKETYYPAAPASQESPNNPHVCSLCGKSFGEVVALQVHIIKSHGAFPPEGYEKEEGEVTKEPGHMSASPPLHSGALSPPSSNKQPSPSPSPPAPKTEEDEDEDSKSQEFSTRVQPSQEDKLHTNIELLHRHMLSTQFSGLMSPLMNNFPGTLPFPFQKLLAPPIIPTKEETPPKTPAIKPKSRRFKCPKCGAKFKIRSLALSHVQSAHGSNGGIRRRLRYPTSPFKQAAGKKGRSEYVRHLMELLKVPTSRGSPSSKKSDHIMQPFLLKAPEDSFVPSLVYLPVARRLSGPRRVAFDLIPA